jgi:hypothetical protein
VRRPFILLVTAAVVAACAKSAEPLPHEPLPVPRVRPRVHADIETARLLTRGRALIATAVEGAALDVHAAPGTDRPYMSLEAANPWGQRLRFLVLHGGTDEDGDIWLRIQLPIWPNGQEGWVAASDVRLVAAAERITVDLSERKLVRRRAGAPPVKLEVAIGSSSTPTPPGRYFVWAKVATHRPSGPYGSYILGLSGFSEAIEPWEDWPGEPRLAIHGTDDPGDAGHAVSKGCVRVLNAALRVLRDVPMGTPVVIRA